MSGVKMEQKKEREKDACTLIHSGLKIDDRRRREATRGSEAITK